MTEPTLKMKMINFPCKLCKFEERACSRFIKRDLHPKAFAFALGILNKLCEMNALSIDSKVNQEGGSLV